MNNNSLNRKQFDILTYLEKNNENCTQRTIAAETKMSIGSVNHVISTLNAQGLLKSSKLTRAGYAALEPYRVKRAVFIAAGFGYRLVPITLNTPKPLVRVKGVRMIDTLLDAVLAAGIEEIYVVRGYLGEQFDQLLYKYPMIKFIENPIYQETNNISSVLLARHLLQNAYILESDLYLYNPNLIQKYQYTSNYVGVPVDRTDDWCFETKNNVVTKLMVGGLNCYHWFGISYWNEIDGAKLYEDVKTVYEMPGGKERYWDEVALRYCINNYKVEVRDCTFDDIAEIDTFQELKNIDPAYN